MCGPLRTSSMVVIDTSLSFVGAFLVSSASFQSKEVWQDWDHHEVKSTSSYRIEERSTDKASPVLIFTSMG